MSDNGSDLAERVARRGREVVIERLRAAFAHQAARRADTVEVPPARLEQMVREAADRAGGALWRRSLAAAVSDELGIDFEAAVEHPVLERARELAGAPVYLPPPSAMATDVLVAPASDPPAALADDTRPEPSLDEPTALRLGAVHITGIETLRAGDRDIELRLSDAGLDVLRHSDGAAIGRLEWSEIVAIELPAPRRGLPGRRRTRELQVSTSRGQAQFELPGLSDEDLREHLEPTLSRLQAGKRPDSS